MPTAKTYTPLKEIPRTPISRCSQILPNRLQCWKAGEVQVEEEIPVPDGSDVSTGRKTATYQLCMMHTLIQQAADQLETKAVEEDSAKYSEDASNLNAAAPPAGTPAVPPNQAETTPPPESTNLSNAVQTPTGTITSPPAGSFHEQLLQTLGEKQQTAMPQGEDSPNNK